MTGAGAAVESAAERRSAASEEPSSRGAAVAKMVEGAAAGEVVEMAEVVEVAAVAAGGAGAAAVVAVPEIAAVIVVAGGRSIRFGSDKLAHRIEGRTLLERAVDAAARLSDVVLVTAAAVPPGVSIAVCESPRWGGPCAAIAAGLDAVDAVDARGAADANAADADATTAAADATTTAAADAATDVLILPADLSHPDAAVAALAAMREGVLLDPDGTPQWLLARAPLGALRSRASELRARHGSLAGLPARELLAVVHGRQTVAGSVVADIDTIADLEAGDPILEEDPIHGTV